MVNIPMLKEIIKLRGFTLPELAAVLGMSKQNLYNMLSNNGENMKSKLMDELRVALQLNIETARIIFMATADEVEEYTSKESRYLKARADIMTIKDPKERLAALAQLEDNFTEYVVNVLYGGYKKARQITTADIEEMEKQQHLAEMEGNVKEAPHDERD